MTLDEFNRLVDGFGFNIEKSKIYYNEKNQITIKDDIQTITIINRHLYFWYNDWLKRIL